MDRNSPQFKKLQKQWYEKLAKEGFEDIEQTDGNLKVWTSHIHRSLQSLANPTLREAKETYYRLASQFLHEFVFPDQKTKKIWQMHSDGISYRHIAKELAKSGHHADKDSIWRIVRNLRNEMKKQYENK